MPTYEYACTACGHRLEAVQSFTDDPLTECPECGGALRKVYGAVGIVLKGSGFYKTDSRAADKRSGSDKASSNGSDRVEVGLQVRHEHDQGLRGPDRGRRPTQGRLPASSGSDKSAKESKPAGSKAARLAPEGRPTGRLSTGPVDGASPVQSPLSCMSAMASV